MDSEAFQAKKNQSYFFASRSRSAVTTAGCSIFLVFCTLTIFKKLGGGTQMWIFMKKAQQRSSFSWRLCEAYMMIWCVYIYIFHICLYYIYLVFQSFSMDFHHFDHQLQVSFWWWRSCPLPWLWSRCPRHCFGSKPHQQKKGENLRVLIWICLNCFVIFDLINIYI